MTIRFVRASDVKVGALCVCLYGRPSAGKTSLAMTAAKPVLLDFDRGVHRAILSGDPPVVPVQSWQDIATLDKSDLQGIRTVVVDTVGALLVSLSADIIRRNPKHGRAGSLTLQGYGALKAEFRAWLAHLREMGPEVVLVAHAEEKKRGDDVVDRIDAMGSSKQEVYQRADLIGRMGVGPKGERMLSFAYQPGAFTKNVGLPEYLVDGPPEGCLEGIIQEAKKMMTREPIPSAIPQSKPKAAERWGWHTATTADDFTAVAKGMKDAPLAEKREMMARATKLGFRFDRKAGGFVNA